MKKLFVLAALTITATLFTTISVHAQSEYSDWSTTSCFKGLDYCVKRNYYNSSSGKYEWRVKFRNRYNSTISFSYTAVASSVNSARTDHRTTLRSGSETSQWFLIADDNAIRVFVDKLRFGSNDTGDYESCDK